MPSGIDGISKRSSRRLSCVNCQLRRLRSSHPHLPRFSAPLVSLGELVVHLPLATKLLVIRMFHRRTAPFIRTRVQAPRRQRRAREVSGGCAFGADDARLENPRFHADRIRVDPAGAGRVGVHEKVKSSRDLFYK